MASAVGIEVTQAVEAFRWNEGQLRHLLSGIDGPVGHDLARRAIRVEGQAKVNASHTPPSVPGEGPAVRTGRLRGSITWRLGFDAGGLYADVGSAVYYAAYVELGTTRMEARPFLRPALDAVRI